MPNRVIQDLRHLIRHYNPRNSKYIPRLIRKLVYLFIVNLRDKDSNICISKLDLLPINSNFLFLKTQEFNALGGREKGWKKPRFQWNVGEKEEKRAKNVFDAFIAQGGGVDLKCGQVFECIIELKMKKLLVCGLFAQALTLSVRQGHHNCMQEHEPGCNSNADCCSGSCLFDESVDDFSCISSSTVGSWTGGVSYTKADTSKGCLNRYQTGCNVNSDCCSGLLCYFDEAEGDTICDWSSSSLILNISPLLCPLSVMLSVVTTL